MQIQIHTTVEIKDSVQDAIREKVEKLGTYYDRIERADVYLIEGNGTKNNSKIAEIRLAVPKNDLFVSQESDSFSGALASAVEKLKRQLIKHKQKLSQY